MTETSAAALVCDPAPPSSFLRWLAVGLAVAGWVLSSVLFAAGGRGVAQSALLDAVCGGGGAGATWDCRSVLASRWGYLQIGPDEGALRLPVSALGMAYFGAVGLWYLFVGRATRARRGYHVLVLLVVAAGCLDSLEFVRVMAFELHQWCGLCLATHGVNGALLVVTILAWPWRSVGSASPPHPSGRLVLATSTAAVLLALCHLLVAVTLVQGTWLRRVGEAYRAIVDDPAYIAWDYERRPVEDLPVYPDEPLLGSPRAPHTVVVFGDFQCSQCRSAHDTLAALVQEHPGELRVAFRHFPQDPACNPHPNYRGGGHPGACRAARAVEAARIVGGSAAAVALRDLMYKQQRELESGHFVDWAREVGLEGGAFRAAMDSPAAMERVGADVELGLRLGISAVPVVYLDGRRLVGWSKPRIWEALLGVTDPAPASGPALP